MVRLRMPVTEKLAAEGIAEGPFLRTVCLGIKATFRCFYSGDFWGGRGCSFGCFCFQCSYALGGSPPSGVGAERMLSHSTGSFFSCAEPFEFYEVPLVSCWPQGWANRLFRKPFSTPISGRHCLRFLPAVSSLSFHVRIINPSRVALHTK